MEKKRQVGNHKRKSLHLSCSLAMPGLLGGDGAHRVTSLGSHSHALPSTSNPLPPAESQIGFLLRVLNLGSWVLLHHLLPPASPKWQEARKEKGQGGHSGWRRGVTGVPRAAWLQGPRHARPLVNGCRRKEGMNKRTSDV